MILEKIKTFISVFKYHRKLIKEQQQLPAIFSAVPNMNISEVRDLIADIEYRVSQAPQIEPPVKHHFSKDVYARELFIPKGTLIVGKIHKYENFNILSTGEMSVLSIDGVMRIKAPYSVVSSAGVKRVAYAHTDCIWTTIHGTDLLNVDKIEEKFIAKNYSEVPLLSNVKLLKERK